MLLVIFGAGASYDSVLHLPPSSSNQEFRPPLADQLFDSRPLFVNVMQAYPAFKPVVNLLRGNVHVERQLAKFEQEATGFPVRRRQLAAITYYLHQVLWHCQKSWWDQHRGITNYLTFLDAIDRWRYENNQQICFVTFNYDTMLEQSLQELWGCKFDDLSLYTRDSRFKLIKLHGSIDWGRRFGGIRGQGTPAEIIDDAIEQLDISDHYEKVDLGMKFRGGAYGFPALAIPVEKKSEFACPQEHLRTLADTIPNVTKIIAIGWRATEQHFLTMLRKPLTGLQGDVDVMIVSGDSRGAKETAENLSIGGPTTQRKRALLPGGFSGLIREIGYLEQFLR